MNEPLVKRLLQLEDDGYELVRRMLEEARGCEGDACCSGLIEREKMLKPKLDNPTKYKSIHNL